MAVPGGRQESSSVDGAWKLVPETGADLKTQQRIHFRRRACPWGAQVPVFGATWLRRDSLADFIFIPLEFRRWRISRFSLSARLERVLTSRDCRVLGDLHGLRLTDVIRWRNCGKKMVQELIRLVRNVQEGNYTNWRDTNAAGANDHYEI